MSSQDKEMLKQNTSNVNPFSSYVNSPQHIDISKSETLHVVNGRKVPQILSLAASRIDQWGAHSWKWLTKLRLAILIRVSLGKRRSTRTMRKEQREAITALLKVMLSYLDLKTMQIGVYNPATGVFAHLSLDYLAHKAGLNIWTAQRAMAWLYDSGYLVAYRQSTFDIESNEFTYKPSIRRISNMLLTDLGITDLSLSRARTKSKKSAMKEAVTHVIKKTADQVKNVVSVAFNKMSAFSSPKQTGMSSSEYAEKLKKLMAALPHLSLSEAQQMLPRPSS